MLSSVLASHWQNGSKDTVLHSPRAHWSHGSGRHHPGDADRPESPSGGEYGRTDAAGYLSDVGRRILHLHTNAAYRRGMGGPSGEDPDARRVGQSADAAGS